MNVEWLKSLAVGLRGALAEHGVTVSHGQALDLIAAVPGLRDWPEVIAFPDRVAACRFDEDAVERIARRVTGRYPVGTRPEMLTFSLRHMSLFYRSSSRSMQRLIVTSDSSGAGHLKQARIADHVIESHAFDRLVSGPIPPGQGPSAFLKAREAAYDRDPLIAGELEWNRAKPALRRWSELLVLCKTYERIELWIDPDPDAQLRFIQSLDWLGAHPDVVEKLYMVHADDPLGGRGPDALRTFEATADKVGAAHLRIARLAWDAYRRPSPEAWFALLDADLQLLPHLRRAVLLLLGELPDAGTALGATERLLLDVVAPGGATPSRFMHFNTQLNPARVYGLFGECRILNRLGGCQVPAILGLQDTTFGFDAMSEPERHARYRQSELSLSDLGKALLAGGDDFARHNPIHRWWGGTLLTNANLWRWDAARQRLIAPA